jgi:hypothetical protein
MHLPCVANNNIEKTYEAEGDLEGSVVALVAHTHQHVWPHVRVANDTLSVAYVFH